MSHRRPVLTSSLRLIRRVVAAVAAGVLAVLLSVTTAPSASAAEPWDPQAAHQFVADYLDRHGLPAAAVAVVHDGEPVWEDGLGEGVSARTPMEVGSVSKMITAFAVLQLVDAGRVALDDPVVAHLPEFALDDPRGASITVRQLLSHTSGVPNPTFVPPADSLQEAVTRLRTWSLSSAPGTRYAYANANYWTAARLVEVVSGTDFPGYLHQHVFAPLGMQDTYAVGASSPDAPGFDAGHVTAYGAALPLPQEKQVTGGAEGVVSTAHDLALWLGMQQRGGLTADGERLLSAELITAAQTPQPAAPTYGFGWQRTSTADPARVGHDGTSLRYTARVDLVPSSGYGVVVLLDSFTTTRFHPFAISTGLVDLSEGRPADPGTPWPTIIDLVLGLIALTVLVTAALGVRRSGRWVQRRDSWPGWRFVLRLLPQLIMPVVAVVAFLVLPQIGDNSTGPVDVLGLWPALMIVVLAAAVGGLALTAARAHRRIYRKRVSSKRVSTS